MEGESDERTERRSELDASEGASSRGMPRRRFVAYVAQK